MKLTAAFFKLIRWPNLVFIIITQLLFYYCIYVPLLPQYPDTSSQVMFCWLMSASVLIAAAGYIINDYFDVQIDAVNKPEKVIVDKFIRRRSAILWHWIFSAAGIVISLYVTWRTGVWLISAANFICVVLLWFYSTGFKKKLLSGNIIIAALTAWVIMVVYFFAGADLFTLHGWATEDAGFNVRKLFKLTMLYAGFAFIVSLIREVIKDLEDMDGDRRYNCNTMPVAWGVPATKVFIAVWIIVCVASLVAVELYAWQSGWWIVTLYAVIFIILPFIYLLKKLNAANVPSDYHSLSSLVKAIMLAGILSMIFFKFTA